MADSKKPYGDVPYADPGYLDADGNQASKSGKPGVKRYPLTADKVVAAWSYINQKKNAGQYTPEQLSAIKGKIKTAMAKFGHKVSQGNSAPADGEIRTFDLPDLLAVTENGDGLTFEGYAAVYNSPTRISGWEGDFDEQIAPGAFRSVAAGNYPVLMFEHGRHPLIGTMPLGRLTAAREDPKGLFVTARLTDNWLIQPVRDAVRDQAVTGMSFRFTVDDDGETWTDRQDDVPLRTLTSVTTPELGPVVFPAYEPTTAAVRSALDSLEDFTGRDSARSAPGGEKQDDVQPGNGGPSLSQTSKTLRDRVWRMRGIR